MYIYRSSPACLSLYLSIGDLDSEASLGSRQWDLSKKNVCNRWFNTKLICFINTHSPGLQAAGTSSEALIVLLINHFSPFHPHPLHFSKIVSSYGFCAHTLMKRSIFFWNLGTGAEGQGWVLLSLFWVNCFQSCASVSSFARARMSSSGFCFLFSFTCAGSLSALSYKFRTISGNTFALNESL